MCQFNEEEQIGWIHPIENGKTTDKLVVFNPEEAIGFDDYHQCAKKLIFVRFHVITERCECCNTEQDVAIRVKLMRDLRCPRCNGKHTEEYCFLI